MDERPDQPSGPAGHVEPEDIRDGSTATNDCNRAPVDVSERRKRPLVAANPSSNRVGGVGACCIASYCALAGEGSIAV